MNLHKHDRINIILLILLMGILLCCVCIIGAVLDLFADERGMGNQFHFARLQYASYSPEMYYPNDTERANWFTDHSDGSGRSMEAHLIPVIKRLTRINVGEPVVVQVWSPEVFRYPFIYTVEPEQMVLTNVQAARMRAWLHRGGFWMLDDFHGCDEKEHVMRQMERVFGYRPDFAKLTTTHDLFHTVFDIDEMIQAPVIWIGTAYNTDPETVLDEVVSKCTGPEILLWTLPNDGHILLTFNVDLGDSIEWADAPDYPNKFSVYGYKLFINTIAYAMSH